MLFRKGKDNYISQVLQADTLVLSTPKHCVTDCELYLLDKEQETQEEEEEGKGQESIRCG